MNGAGLLHTGPALIYGTPRLRISDILTLISPVWIEIEYFLRLLFCKRFILKKKGFCLKKFGRENDKK